MSDAVLRAAERASFASQDPSDIAIYWALALRAGRLPKTQLEIESDNGPSFFIWTLFPKKYDKDAPGKLNPARVIDWRVWKLHGMAHSAPFDLMLPGNGNPFAESYNEHEVKDWLTQLLVRFEGGIDA